MADPARLNVDEAFRELLMTYVRSCTVARGERAVIRLGAVVYDKADSMNLIPIVRAHYPGVQVIRKPAPPQSLAVHRA